MDTEIAIALIGLVGKLLWPGVAIFVFLYILQALRSGVLTSILPYGGAISYGDVRLEVQSDLNKAEKAVDDVSQDAKPLISSEADKAIDERTEPYDLVMETWYKLSDSITKLAVKNGGEDDRRQVWTHLENLCSRGVINEAQKGAVRDLQKARNSIRRLREVDRETAANFAETARKLTATYDGLLSDQT